MLADASPDLPAGDSLRARPPTPRIGRAAWATRLLVALALAADAAASLDHWRTHHRAGGLIQPITDLTVLVTTLVSLWFPWAAAILAIVPLTWILVFNTYGSEAILLLVFPAVAMISLPRRRMLYTACGLLAFCVIRAVLRTDSAPIPVRLLAYLAILAAGCVVGAVVRLLLGAGRRGRVHVDRLQEETAGIRDAERGQLAVDLRRVVSRRLVEVQGVLQRVGESGHPADIRAALRDIQEACRGALVELRALVGLLRDDDQPDSSTTTMQPPSEVAERAEHDLITAGYPTTLQCDPRVDALPPSNQRAINHVVREAVSNIVNHAERGAEAELSIACDGAETRVVVRNRLARQDRDAGRGEGVLRLQARLAALGGAVTAGRSGEDWVLSATIPRLVAGSLTAPRASLGAVPARRRVPAALSRGWSRIRSPRTLATVLVTGCALPPTGAMLTSLTHGSPDPGAIVALLSAAAIIALIWQPALGYGLGLVALLAHALTGRNLMAACILLLSLAAHAILVRNARWIGLLAAMLIVTVTAVALLDPAHLVLRGGSYLEGALLVLLASFAGRHFYQLRSQQLRSIERLTQRQAEVRRQERALLSRELHDVVGHQLTVIIMQIMGHGESDDPTELREVLQRIHAATSTTQQELALLVAMMGDSPGNGDDRHVTAELLSESVLTGLTAEGFTCHIVIDEGIAALSPALQLTLSRVLQEATTNILRYAPRGAHCRYAVSVEAGEVRLRVSSPLSQRKRSSDLSSGYGLRGIRERVDLQGGSFAAGAGDGHWNIEMQLPLAR